MYTFKATYNDHPSENNSIVLVSNGERLKTLRKQQNCKITKSCFHQVKSSQVMFSSSQVKSELDNSFIGYIKSFMVIDFSREISLEDVGWKEKAWSTLVCLL